MQRRLIAVTLALLAGCMPQYEHPGKQVYIRQYEIPRARAKTPEQAIDLLIESVREKDIHKFEQVRPEPFWDYDKNRDEDFRKFSAALERGNIDSYIVKYKRENIGTWYITIEAKQGERSRPIWFNIERKYDGFAVDSVTIK